MKVEPNRIPARFWALSVVVVGYVAVCTVQRDNHWSTDAWEHHRALRALAEDLWNPGNPTYATSEPSVRYSPMNVLWALFSRTTGIDPFDTQSVVAVANTLLLVVGVAWLLRSYGEASSATEGLTVMLSLWGGIPGYANSFALADLPWHQVNPSACSLAVTLWAWVLFRSWAVTRTSGFALAVATLLSGMAMLDHVITGMFTEIGIWLVVLTARTADRRRLVFGGLIVTMGTLILCAVWPWYDFFAMSRSPLASQIFGSTISRKILLEWCFPALVASVVALKYRKRQMVRVSLLGGTIAYMSGVVAYVLPRTLPASGALARLPMPGLLLFHLPIGIFAHHARLFEAKRWPSRLRRLFLGRRHNASQASLEVLLAVSLIYFLAPQLVAICKEPYLARAYVAPLLGYENKQLELRARLGRLLAPVGSRDVIISDPITSEPLPSIRGRVVYSRGEWFVPDDQQRRKDVELFFLECTPTEVRRRILSRYHVRWILLNQKTLSDEVWSSLVRDMPVEGRNRELALLDVHKWQQMNK